MPRLDDQKIYLDEWYNLHPPEGKTLKQKQTLGGAKLQGMSFNMVQCVLLLFIESLLYLYQELFMALMHQMR